MAVQHGLADEKLLRDNSPTLLSLEEGRRLYEQYVNRPLISGGPKESTSKRYRAVLDKFMRFAAGRGIRGWNQVGRSELESYAAWLDQKD